MVCPPPAAGHVGAPAGVHRDIPSAGGLPPSSTRTPMQPSHHSMPAGSGASSNPNHQQELQAKILSLFNSGSGPLSSNTGLAPANPQSHTYSSLGPSPSQNPPHSAMPGPPAAGSQAYGTPPGRGPVTAGGQRPPVSTSGINFDNPSVQKALDTLIQSGPSLNSLVGPGASQQPPTRPSPSMGQTPSMSMYPRHY